MAMSALMPCVSARSFSSRRDCSILSAKIPTRSAKANAMALSRVRQLAAHETGHTLGLMHNYAASIDNRSSVMDYPPPTVSVGANGIPDVSNAYAVGIGAWDKTAITYGYADLPPGSNETQALDKVSG